MLKIALIALAGAFGTLCRYWLSGREHPWVLSFRPGLDSERGARFSLGAGPNSHFDGIHGRVHHILNLHL